MPDHEDSSLIPAPDGSLANRAPGARRIITAMVEEALEVTRQTEIGSEEIPDGGVQAGEAPTNDANRKTVCVSSKSIAELREELYKRSPEVFQSGTPENAAFVGHAKEFGELSAHENFEGILAALKMAGGMVNDPVEAERLRNKLPEIMKDQPEDVKNWLEQDVSKPELSRRDVTITGSRFKIGNQELCEPDFRQVLIWAKSLALDPEEFLRRLLDDDCRYIDPWGPNEIPHSTIGYHHFDLQPTTIVAGRIVTLTWAFNPLPLRHFEWVDSLEIECINIWPGTRSFFEFPQDGEGIESLCPRLTKLSNFSCESVPIRDLELTQVPNLTELTLNDCGLKTLDLKAARRLTELRCEDNELQELNLSNLTELQVLHCCSNRLSVLDLTGVPHLIDLACSSNRELRSLDLSPVPKLKNLRCSYNKLTHLDLRNNAELVDVDCDHNQLASLKTGKLTQLEELDISNNNLVALDLSGMPQLAQLSCRENQLTHLDLSHVGRLSGLYCSHNRLISLNLFMVPDLVCLYCEDNRLAALDLSGVRQLWDLSCESNPMTELDICPVQHLRELSYEATTTRLIQRPDQHF